MSIILDALKRAEGLRKKNQPPTLMSGGAPAPRRNTRVIVLAAAFVTAGLGAWLWRPSTEAGTTSAAEQGAEISTIGEQAPQTEANTPSGVIDERPLLASEPVQQVNVSSMAGDVSSSRTAPTLNQTLTAPALLAAATQVSSKRNDPPVLDQALTQTAMLSTQQQAEALAKRQAQQPVVMPVESQPINPAPIEAPAQVAPVVIQTPPPPSEPAPPALPTIFELDYPIRLALPKMLVSMYVYNANPEFRFLIVNGKKVRQGEQVEASVTFSEIRRDGVECDYQGTRFFFPRTSL